MTVRVDLWPQVREDFKALPSDRLRWVAMKHLVRLEREPKFGKPLKNHPILGDLSDCRKIYVDESHDRDPRWRIIYRLLPNESQPEVAEVIIIGPRADAAVYTEVLARLGRAAAT